PRHVLIGGVADHQRHALVGKGRLTHQQQHCCEAEGIKFCTSEQVCHGDTGKLVVLGAQSSRQQNRGFVRLVTHGIPAFISSTELGTEIGLRGSIVASFCCFRFLSRNVFS